uniref:Ig-like domain-containing protein n=1 Tax=Daphnia galeata TaxID=27404 RepID=A0A8J2S1J6_9CRUS|nr:unnamed protein product [Daphnia galeata]
MTAQCDGASHSSRDINDDSRTRQTSRNRLFWLQGFFPQQIKRPSRNTVCSTLRLQHLQFVNFHETKFVINAAEGKVEYLIVDHEKLDIQIPCKPTHPYVTVYLIHSQIFINLSKTVTFMDDLEKKTTAVLTKHDLLTSVPADSNRWTFNPRQGLTLKIPKIVDVGFYILYGVFNNNFQLLDAEFFFLRFQGYQTPQIIANATQRVIEAGSNLTLTCVYALVFEHGKDNLKIVWDYPQSLSITPTKMVGRKTNPQHWYDRNETHIYIENDCN